MTISTIKRAFIYNSDYNIKDLVTNSKKKNHEFIYYIRKILYNIITFGLKESIETLRDKRRENEIINVISNIINNVNNNNNKENLIHTDLKYGYVIKQINQQLYIYQGKFSKITGQFHPDQKSKCLLVDNVNNLVNKLKDDIVNNFKNYQEYKFMNIIYIINNLDDIIFPPETPKIRIITADIKLQKIEDFINNNEQFKDALLKIKLQNIATCNEIENKYKIHTNSKQAYNLMSLHGVLKLIIDKQQIQSFEIISK